MAAVERRVAETVERLVPQAGGPADEQAARRMRVALRRRP
jgi:hypothetical protein